MAVRCGCRCSPPRGASLRLLLFHLYCAGVTACAADAVRLFVAPAACREESGSAASGATAASPTPRGTTLFQTCFNILNLFVGAGVLSIPVAATCGFCFGRCQPAASCVAPCPHPAATATAPTGCPQAC
jgi:hypothetical protein